MKKSVAGALQNTSFEGAKRETAYVKTKKIAYAATKSLLDSQAEDQYFRENFQPQPRIDAPRVFRISSDVEKESLHQVRNTLRKNTYVHTKFEP